MCFKNIWLLPDTGADTEFPQITRQILGTSPEPMDVAVLSPKVANLPQTIAVSPRRCDCESLIGSPHGGAVGELTYPQIREWLDHLAQRFGRKSRVGLIRAWSPRGSVEPEHTMSVRLDTVDEDFLRGVAENHLILIRFSQW